MGNLRATETLLAMCLVSSSPVMGQSSNAQPAAQTDFVIMNAWSDPLKCNSENARRLTFVEAFRDSASMKGECVAVEGFLAGRALFRRAVDAKRKHSNFAPSLEQKRIGVYAKYDRLKVALKRGGKHTVVGVLGQCETEWPEALTVMGYCHSVGAGPIIKVSEMIAVHTRDVR